MKFDKTSFGKIWIDGKKYSHDVYIYPDGKIEKRNKKNSPRIDGHRSLSEWELNLILEKEPEVLIIGMGQSGVLPFTEDVKQKLSALKDEKEIELVRGNTPDILEKANEKFKSGRKVAAIIHTTC
ncbi:MAG: hypothetical protein BAJALOKI1v1_640001 [Promethearchaeota archaeon]|nr:MAG: hypothetical protein BAJALOKI1v1_640001 [Candidatus Lokiarchaeota archaeon]